MLARDVTDGNGRMLLAAGKKIQEKHLKIFRAWGITEVDVEGSQAEQAAGPLNEAVDSGRTEEIPKKMRVLFKHNDLNHPAIKELLDICIARQPKENSGSPK